MGKLSRTELMQPEMYLIRLERQRILAHNIRLMLYAAVVGFLAAYLFGGPHG